MDNLKVEQRSLVSVLANLLNKTPQQIWNLDIIELFKEIRKVEDISQLKNIFSSKYGYILSNKFSGSNYVVINIKYIDGFRVEWTKWARQMRGTSLIVYTDSYEVDLLKYTFQRGIEIGTDELAEWTSSTQDVDNFNKLDNNKDPFQLKMLNMNKNDSIESIYVDKIDGSFLGVLKIHKKTKQYQVYKDIIDASDDISWKFYLDLGDYLFIPTSQNTLLIDYNSDFFNTFCSSIICCIEDTNKTYDQKLLFEDFKRCWKIFISRLEGDSDQIMCFCFEIVCKNQTNLLGNNIPFLAVKYDYTDCFLLGIRIYGDSTGVYTPIHDSKHFKTCLSWKISKLDDINNIQVNKMKLLLNEITIDEFFVNCPTINKKSDVHFEGGVLLTYKLGNETLNDPDYAKVKLGIWYVLHKRKDMTQKAINLLPENRKHMFPIINSRREDIITEVNQYLDKCVNDTQNKNVVFPEDCHEKRKEKFYEYYEMNNKVHSSILQIDKSWHDLKIKNASMLKYLLEQSVRCDKNILEKFKI